MLDHWDAWCAPQIIAEQETLPESCTNIHWQNEMQPLQYLFTCPGLALAWIDGISLSTSIWALLAVLGMPLASSNKNLFDRHTRPVDGAMALPCRSQNHFSIMSANIHAPPAGTNVPLSSWHHAIIPSSFLSMHASANHMPRLCGSTAGRSLDCDRQATNQDAAEGDAIAGLAPMPNYNAH